MQMIADLHTHTLCATHAYNTFTGWPLPPRRWAIAPLP